MARSEQERFAQMIAESCPFKFVMSGGMGFLAGGVFGLFTSSMQYDRFGSQSMQEMSLKQSFKEMGSHSFSYAKNFMIVGAIYAGTECLIESYRAKHDIYNSASAGCITGSVLAYKTGPKGMALGCAGFAAFSTAIDYWMEYRD